MTVSSILTLFVKFLIVTFSTSNISEPGPRTSTDLWFVPLRLKRTLALEHRARDSSRSALLCVRSTAETESFSRVLTMKDMRLLDDYPVATKPFGLVLRSRSDAIYPETPSRRGAWFAAGRRQVRTEAHLTKSDPDRTLPSCVLAQPARTVSATPRAGIPAFVGEHGAPYRRPDYRRIERCPDTLPNLLRSPSNHPSSPESHADSDKSQTPKRHTEPIRRP